MSFFRAAAVARTVTRGIRIAASAPVRCLAVTPDAVYRSKSSAPVPQKGKKEAKDLASVLERELAYEREDNTTVETLKSLAAGITDFKLTDTAGHARFFLTRTVGGQEIRIDVDCTPVSTDDDVAEEAEEPAAAEGEEEEEEPPVAEGYRVLINMKDTVKNKTLQVGGVLTDHLRVHRVTLYESGKEPEAGAVFSGVDELPQYAGPVFEELDDALQNAFYEYLEDRGIHDDLAATLSDYASTKEQIEYVRWLENIKGFAQ